jgi:hypothetical protein
MAASAGAIRAGKAFVEIFADNNPLTRGLKAAEGKLKAFGAGVAGIGRKLLSVAGLFSAGGAAGLAATAKAFGDMGGELVDLSQRTGIAVESLSELGFAAAQTGADLGTVEIGIKKMQDTLVQAAAGSQSAQTAFSRLGLTVADLARLTPDQQLETIAEALAQVRDPALRTSIALDIFGKSGTELIPLLNEGAAGLQRYRKQANELGLVLSTDSVQAADDFGDSLATLWKQVKVGAFNIGSALLPELQQLVQTGMRVVAAIVGWVRENRELIVTVAKVALAVTAAGAALFAIGQAIAGIGAVFGLLASAGTMIGTVLATVGSVLAALLSPIGLVGAAAVALGAYFLATSEQGGEAVDWLSEKFEELLGDATAAFAGIRDALAAGDLGLAMRIVGNLLSLEWQKALLFLQEKWIGFKDFFLSVWTEATFGLSKLFLEAWAGLQTGWQKTVDFLSDAWTVFSDFVMANWNTAVGFIEKAWVRLKSVFDKDIDVTAEVERINKGVAGKNDRRTNDRNRAILEREQQRRQREQEIEQQKAGALRELEEARQRAQADRQSQHDAELAGAEDRLAKSRDELAASLAEAARKRQEAEEGRGPDVSRLKKGAAGAGEALTGLGGDKTAVQGTFNAAGLRGLAGGNAADRTAKATEETSRNTKRLLQAAERGGLQFS